MPVRVKEDHGGDVIERVQLDGAVSFRKRFFIPTHHAEERRVLAVGSGEISVQFDRPLPLPLSFCPFPMNESHPAKSEMSVRKVRSQFYCS